MSILGVKVCTKCGETKTADDFYKAKDMKDGRQSLCKSCKREHSRNWWHANIDKNRANVNAWHRANRPRVLENVKAWKSNNRDKTREQHLKRKYGITEVIYQTILSGQGGVCAICGAGETDSHGKLHVDHDHSTGVVRGILCGKCNKGLGLFNDSAALFKSAASYLESKQAV